jgi:hypothetical protein
MWNPIVAADITAKEAEIRGCSLVEAQPWCNFSVLTSRLPDTKITSSLRPEAPPGRIKEQLDRGRSPWSITNRSTIRSTLVREDAAFRLKQFLYDWGPPTCAHPSLWKSKVTPVLERGRILWLGVDYRGKRAVAMIYGRTTLELSAETAQTTDEALIEVATSLEPISADAHSAICCTPLFQLAYSARHTDKPSGGPYGFWKHGGDARMQTSLTASAADYNIAQIKVANTILEPDSVLTFHAAGKIHEIEFLWSALGNPELCVRAIYTPSHLSFGVVCPAELNQHPAITLTEGIGPDTIYLAFANKQHGPFEAVSRVPHGRVMILVAPHSQIDLDSAKYIIRQVISQLSSKEPFLLTAAG